MTRYSASAEHGKNTAMIDVTARIAIDEREIEESFVRASGRAARTSTSFPPRYTSLRREALAVVAARRARAPGAARRLASDQRRRVVIIAQPIAPRHAIAPMRSIGSST